MPFIHSQNEKMLADSAYQSTRPQIGNGTPDRSNVSSGISPKGSISRPPIRCVYAQISMACKVCVSRRDRIT